MFPIFKNELIAKLLSPERQYGLSVVGVLVLTQGFRYILDENVQYSQKVLGSKASNGLVAMIYEKYLRCYPSSDFAAGEIVNFCQTDAQKLYFFC